MPSNPWFAFFWADYLAATPGLSLMEHGAYLLLLIECYRVGGVLDAPSTGRASVEHASLYKICRALNDDEQSAVDSVLWRYFRRNGDSYTHDRVIEELAKRVKRQAKGKQAAGVRWPQKDLDQRMALSSEHNPEQCPEESPRPCLGDGSHNSQPQSFTPPNRRSVREGERTDAPLIRAGFQTGKGPSPRTRQAMEWVQNKIHASPAAVADMRKQDRAINRAIQLCGEWTKLSAELADPATAHVASGDFMRAFAAACAESDEAKQGAAASA